MTKVAIVIPCRNEEQYISKCIDSVLQQEYAQDKLEVFVCDGCSDDSTVEIVNQYCQKHANVKLLVNKKRTTPYALNLGLKTSDADVKIILGAHSEIKSDYVANCVSCFEVDSQIGCVGGILDNVYESETAQVIGEAMSSPFGVGNAHFRTGAKDGYVDTVAFGAYRKEVFETVGYFDEELTRNQDDEFNFRVQKAGYKIYLSKTIRADYYVRASYSKLARQYYQYGYWKVFVNKKHATVTSIRQLVPMIFVLFLLSFPCWIIMNLTFIFIFGLSCYGLGALFFAHKTTTSIWNIPAIVFTFLLLHIGYGSGYLEGVLNFLLLGRSPKRASSVTSR